MPGLTMALGCSKLWLLRSRQNVLLFRPRKVEDDARCKSKLILSIVQSIGNVGQKVFRLNQAHRQARRKYIVQATPACKSESVTRLVNLEVGIAMTNAKEHLAIGSEMPLQGQTVSSARKVGGKTDVMATVVGIADDRLTVVQNAADAVGIIQRELNIAAIHEEATTIAWCRIGMDRREACSDIN